MNRLVSSNTPAVSILDNRRLVVRDMTYHRHPETPDVTHTCITGHRYDSRRSLIRSADSRLHGTGHVNFLYSTDITGKVLCTRSVDAGTSLTLDDASGRPLRVVSNLFFSDDGSEDSSQAVTCFWNYEDGALAGRLVSVEEQKTGEGVMIAERVVYAGNGRVEKALNLAGRCTSHYNPAGLVHIDKMGLTGLELATSRRLLKGADDAAIVANWLGRDASEWSEMLDSEALVSLKTPDSTNTVVATTDATGNMQSAAYDLAGRLSGRWLTIKRGPQLPVVLSQFYSAAGQKLREDHGNGIVVTYTYSPESQRLIAIKTERHAGHVCGMKILQDLRYVYDPVGNVLSVCDKAQNVLFWRNQKMQPENTYIYDSLYQLVRTAGREMASHGRKVSSPPSDSLPLPADRTAYTNYTRTYLYDAAGNLTQVGHSAPATGNNYIVTITVSNRSNRSVLSTLSENPAEVDELFTAGGQQKALQLGQVMMWTSRKELSRVTQVMRDGMVATIEHYRYDGSSQRVLKVCEQKTISIKQTQRVQYLPGLELRTTKVGDAEKESLQVITVGEAGQPQVRVLHWLSGRPAEISNDQVRYAYGNLTGNIGMEVDGKGNVICMEEYYPYGGTAILTARNAMEVDYKSVRYSGKERDSTGLYYYGYRYYQPQVGRWLSADPAGTVDGLNLFRMVRNNPVTLLDRTGLQPQTASLHSSTEIDDLDIVKNFDLGRGDLVYGLAVSTVSDEQTAPRQKYIEDLMRSGAVAVDASVTIDAYNHVLAGAITKANSRLRSDMIKQLMGRRTPRAGVRLPSVSPKKFGQEIEVPKHIAEQLMRDRKRPLWGAYFNEGVKNKKFDVASIYEEVKISPSLTAFHQWDGDLEDPKGVAPELLWKRGSKLGIAMATRGSGHIHFVLDEIVVASVVSKNGVEGQSITASELRYAFRNKDKLVGAISFYKNNIQTEAPWETNPWQWGSYMSRVRAAKS